MKLSRREFINHTGVGLAGAALSKTTNFAQNSPTSAGKLPHRAVPLEGFHGYPSVQTVEAGEKIAFHLSSSVPYQLSICRLGKRIDDSASDEVLYAFKPGAAAAQPIYPGSYVAVDKALPRTLAKATFECWLRPWKHGRAQAIFSAKENDQSAGFELLLNDQGRLALRMGTGKDRAENLELTGPLAPVKKWSHLACVLSGSHTSLWLDGRQAIRLESKRPLMASGRLRIGAAAREGKADDFLDGDLAMPVIYNRALADAEIKARFEAKGLTLPKEGVLAAWKLDEEGGERLNDASGNKYHGQIINRGTWMIGGPSFDCAVPRYADYHPSKDPQRGHGLRLASDQLHDCGWKASQEWRVPRDARAGFYTARARYELNGQPLQYDIAFVVKRGKQQKKAPLLVLASSNTWRAYNGTPFVVTEPGLHHFWGTDGRKNADPRAPAYNFYRDHAAGQPTYQMGLRMPWPAAGPGVLYSDKAVGYSHLARGERFTHLWLEENGYDFDVIDDVDLHRNPGQLLGCKTLLINGHSEYWSIEMYEGVERFLKAGGNVAVLSGNSVFWRVSFDLTAGVMECRKFDSSIGGRAAACIGELWHAQDGKRGSLMRECGYPAWKLIGLECVGWWGTGANDFGWYQADRTDHFLFHTPQETGIQPGESFGHGPNRAAPRAVGHEADIRLSTLKGFTEKTPEGAKLPEEPPGITTLAQSRREQYKGLDFFTHWQNMSPAVLAEIIYWERPGGGKVFNAGAIAGGWPLSVDAKWSALLKNVLHHFGVPAGIAAG